MWFGSSLLRALKPGGALTVCTSRDSHTPEVASTLHEQLTLAGFTGVAVLPDAALDAVLTTAQKPSWAPGAAFSIKKRAPAEPAAAAAAWDALDDAPGELLDDNALLDAAELAYKPAKADDAGCSTAKTACANW